MPDKNKREWVEEFEVSGREAMDRVKELIQEGNVRRLIVRKSNGDVIVELPLTASVVGGAALLVFGGALAPLAAIAAFLAEVKIEVLREEPVDHIYEDDTDDDTVIVKDDKPKKTKIDVE